MALKTKTSCRGQSTLEYAVLVVILIGAMLAMQQYFRRGIMGRIRQSTEDISDTQFDPDEFSAGSRTRTTSQTRELSGTEGVDVGATRTTLLRDEDTRRRAAVWEGPEHEAPGGWATGWDDEDALVGDWDDED